MILSSRHRIRNSSPGGLRPSTLPLGHGGSPQYRLSHVDGEETFFVSFKPPRPGTEPRTLAWKAAVLTTTLGPPPSRLCHEHVLFECPELVNERVKRWTRVKQSMPEALISSVVHINTSGKLVFVLSGLKCEYVSKWTEIYEQIVNFVYSMNHEFRHLAVTIYTNM